MGNKFIYILLVLLYSCVQHKNNTHNLELTLLSTGESVYLNDSVETILKDYKKNESNPKFIGVFGSSLVMRNNILLVKGISGYDIATNRQLPTSYTILEGIPIIFYMPDNGIFQKSDLKAYKHYNTMINKYIKDDTLPRLYSPPIWIIEANRDSTRLYKSLEEYRKQVSFYQPSDTDI